MSTKTKAKAAAKGGTDSEEEESAGGGKKKLIIIVLVVVLIAVAAWWFMLKPASGAPAAPEPGEVVVLDPIQVNLAEGHYLSVGIALQGVKGAHEIDGSKALDATIGLFSGASVEELVKPKERDHMKEELAKEMKHLYHDEVMAVYFTQFVTQ